jgi:UDP-N-acetylglucosamine 2-epimerase (non-hydrolysing)
MHRLKVCTILGTRPEAIKLASVIKRLDEQPQVEQRVLVTGQHRQLLDQVLDLFGIHPVRDLQVMREGQALGTLTARTLQGIEEDLATSKPDYVIVQGDTTSALAGAMAAYFLRIPVAHVEAGLRTYDPYGPFPEEINRQFIDRLSQLHFAPTEHARLNLLREGLDSATIHVTGNSGIDALLDIASRDGNLICPLHSGDLKLLLVTAHRRESFGLELLNICWALRALALRNHDVRIIYAVHLNPNVSETVLRELKGVPRLQLISNVNFMQFVGLMKQSFAILTDSGGVQEEAPSLGKPVLVLRTRTERVEAVEAGNTKLVGTDAERIVQETEELLRDPSKYARMAQVRHLYGDGQAARRIVDIFTQSHCSKPVFPSCRVRQAGWPK